MMESSRDQRWFGLLCLALVLGTFLAYARLWSCDFTAYDDPVYVTENPQVQGGLSLASAVWAFRTSHGGNWHPLTWMSHMLDCQVYGLKPAGHHLTNLLLHSANVLLLFGVLRRLTGALWRSALVAALFAWHPLHAESVAWVAERKDVLSALFWLLTMGAYSRYAEAKGEKHPTPNTQHPISSKSQNPNLSVGRSRLYYTLALTFFALGLLSKPMVVTLPFVLLLLDYWPLARIANSEFQISNWKALLLEKVPFLLLAIGSSVVTVFVQRTGGAVLPLSVMPLAARVSNALVSYARYLEKLAWPANLGIYYPLPPAWAVTIVLGAAALVLVITALAVAGRRPWLRVGWFWFLGTLVPVIGIVQVSNQAMADRYSYLPSIGVFIIAVWGLFELAGRWPEGGRRALAVVFGVALGACIVATGTQVHTWQNTITLFSRALEVTPGNYLAQYYLGRGYEQAGEFEEAVPHFDAAQQIQTGWAAPLFRLAECFEKLGQPQTAVECLEAGLRRMPEDEFARLELGRLLIKQGKLEEAASRYRDALKLDPNQADAHNNLGAVLVRLGQPEQALEHFAAALKLRPNFLEAWFNLGALQAAQGRMAESARAFGEVVRLKPQDAEARLRLGGALARTGQAETAIQEYRAAMQLKPDATEPLAALAGLLASCPKAEVRNGIEAVQLAERAAQLSGRRDPRVLAILDQAYAEAGRFDEAIKTAQQAQELATKLQQAGLAEQATRRLELYRAGKPYRE